MKCFVFKSLKKEGYYLFSATESLVLPVAIEALLQPLAPVLTLSLQPNQVLAVSDTRKVLRSLLVRGFFVQFPSQLEQVVF